MARVSREVDGKIGTFSLNDVLRVTPDVIKAAASKLKPRKSDPVYSFSSDCIKVGHLAVLLSTISRSYLMSQDSFF